jgi:long-chain acyl-CoA synthetase
MIYRVLWRQAKSRPKKIVIVGERRALSYSQLLQEVDRCAVFLQNLNLKPEDPILLGVPPSPEFYVVFYAACAIGATVVPVLPSGKIPPHILKIKPLLAVGAEPFLERVKEECRSLKATIVWDRKNGLRIPETNASFTRRRLVRKERVVAVSSSGTTGNPTVTFQSADLLLERGELKAGVVGIAPEDVLWSSRPFNNGSSINNHLMVPLVRGCKIVVHEKFERFKAAEAIARERVTILYAVAFVFELLASIPPSYPVDFSSLRLCISGGGPLSQYVYDSFYERFGICIRQRYGATQIIPAFTYNLAGVPGAVGQVSGPFPVAVLNDRGEGLEPEHVGEVVFNVSKFAPRWRKWFMSNPHRRGKYIYTGDLGRIDEDGNLYIVGRKSSLIKVGGNRVELAEVENVLRSHPQVSEALVFALRPGEPNEAVGTLVVPSEGLTQGELLRWCMQRLDGYKCPRRIQFRKSLPRNPHGKVVRHGFEAAGSPPPVTAVEKDS